MKSYLLARTLRASGRLFLFAGATLSLGLTLINIYIYFYKLFNPDEVITPVSLTENSSSGAALTQSDPFITIVICVSSIVLACFLIWLIARIYNRNMRFFIVKLAHLFKAQIFTTEIISTLLVWTITTLLLAFTVPLLSIVSIFAFIINELLFIFAWGAYGQPNYKI